MKILFLHGWQSKVGGVKPTSLTKAGHEVINPALDHDDFEAAVRVAQKAFDQHQPEVVVGSSRGGAVALNIESKDTPLVLLCPAWKNWGNADRLKPRSVILHSRCDDVIPFADSEELVEASGLANETLLEVGTDHRLAEPEPLRAMLASCEQHLPKVIGCDFGAPKRAGDQAKKNILIEAVVMGPKHFAVRPFGRNGRLLGNAASKTDWKSRRCGWTLPDLVKSISEDETLIAAAFDFPFSIPVELLRSTEFAQAVGVSAPFETLQTWIDFVHSNFRLEFDTPRAGGEMQDLARFDAWRRDSRYWLKRATDVAAKGQPPLKHVGQNLFAMTIAGACLQNECQKAGFTVVRDQVSRSARRHIFETYPSLVARRVGFKGSYKAQPVECMEQAILFLEAQGIRIDFDEDVRKFCENYRTGSKKDDPDAADAFLCLVAAICFNECNHEIVGGFASHEQLEREGAIVVPHSNCLNETSC